MRRSSHRRMFVLIHVSVGWLWMSAVLLLVAPGAPFLLRDAVGSER